MYKELMEAGFELERLYLVYWTDDDGHEHIDEFVGTDTMAQDEEIRLHELGFDAFIERYEDVGNDSVYIEYAAETNYDSDLF